MGKAQREKGKRWEREVARIMRETFSHAEREGWKQSDPYWSCDCGWHGPRGMLVTRPADPSRSGLTAPTVLVNACPFCEKALRPSAPPDVSAGPYNVECKHGARTFPAKALEQSAASCPPGRIPVAVCKDDRHRPFVVTYLDDWLQLNKEAMGGRLK